MTMGKRGQANAKEKDCHPKKTCIIKTEDCDHDDQSTTAFEPLLFEVHDEGKNEISVELCVLGTG
jgi:hypothetical protein